MTRQRSAWIRRAAATAMVAILGSTFAASALAEERHRGEENRHDRDARWDRHGDIRHFEDRDLRRWRGGRVDGPVRKGPSQESNSPPTKAPGRAVADSGPREGHGSGHGSGHACMAGLPRPV